MANHTASTRLLIRTAEINPAVLAFAAELEAASAHPTALIVDERAVTRAADATDGSRTVIRLSKDACAALRLHCPEDFAWKCGDYGYYRHAGAFRTPSDSG